MKTKLFIILCTLGLSMMFVRATDNYAYGADEYVTIVDGISPDGKYAITTHGGGEYGYDNFHVYLTNSETGKKIGPLEEIVHSLDTGAGSFCAIWSKDSKQVSIFHRISRQEPIQEIIYRIEKNRAFLIKGPAAVEDDYTWYWSNHCSHSPPKGKTFGTPLQH